jgi:hypothetical protein
VSGELIVNDANASKPRVGGFEFSLDAGKRLWLAPQLSEGGWITLTGGVLDLPQWNNALGYTFKMYASHDPGADAPPATASPLWDKPETVTGEIVAYRGWDYDFQVTRDGAVNVRLESRHQDFYWDGPVTTADEPPSASGDHGLYAVAAEAHHAGNFCTYVKDAPIWGRVALSGVVVEGANGYRAERATVQELWVNADHLDDEDSADGMCKALGDRYQCDVSVKAPRFADLPDAEA